MIVHIQCQGCGARMRRDRVVARGSWSDVADTIWFLWVCDTPDCGTSLITEEDA